MITLTKLDEKHYQVVLDMTGLDLEEGQKLLRKRDRFPAEFVKDVILHLPEDVEFDTYDHYQMIVTVKWVMNNNTMS